ncbi:hypothetical protein Rumeso_02032 [Rubellimicrobium mesophilum DSM 19309]|uniref:Lipoprotein n=1 Tax=Rubellimicrobium mesophilum DSM 19309 TaxID=442562 RepID=A0A017HQB2_9RHOB|nr:hypothetical protein [Rubellimicrobium mesophilum]EYD76368.1 hypothetical protein Rumeso_02032 [Rubellimicrobium mesophilum DSM 19309]
MRRLALLPLLALAAPALAQEAAPQQSQPGQTFQPPAGCTAYLTVQMSSCTVSHHFTCENDPAGWQRRVDMDEGGVTYFGAIDGQTEWVESFHVLSQHSEFLAPNPADPANFDDLLSKGEDHWDFTTNSDQIGPTRYVGYDKLTGETTTIDGVTLDRTEYAITAYAPDGSEVWRGTGSEYVSRDWRMFLSGQSSVVVGEDVEEVDDTPKEFIRPGERGFLSVNPKYGCNEVMSSNDAPLMSPVPGGQG